MTSTPERLAHNPGPLEENNNPHYLRAAPRYGVALLVLMTCCTDSVSFAIFRDNVRACSTDPATKENRGTAVLIQLPPFFLNPHAVNTLSDICKRPAAGRFLSARSFPGHLLTYAVPLMPCPDPVALALVSTTRCAPHRLQVEINSG